MRMAVSLVVSLIAVAGCDPFPDYPADARYPDSVARPPDARVTDARELDAPPPDASACLDTRDQRVDACGLCDDGLAVPGGQRLAQVFTPSVTGVIPSVRLLTANADKRNTRVEAAIIDLTGEPLILGKPAFDPDDHVMAVTEVRMSDTVAWNTFGFELPARVIAGRPYAIAVRALGGTEPARWLSFGDVLGPDIYPRGRAFARSPGAPAFTLLPLYQDFVFEVAVVPDVCR